MNFTTQLSIKSALRFALPCLAASLLFMACSNEDAETTPEYNDSVNPTVRFSASAPLSSEVASTRIGIDDSKKPTVGQHTQAEPVIWIADDEVSIVFVQGGNRVYAKFKVDGPTISDDGTSAELVSVDIPTTLNGEYTVYALTPYTTQTANQLTFDLSSQTQSVGHVDYNHLGTTTIMRAGGIPATFTNGATSSVVNFEFEYLTSFLRFNITNDLDESITVTGINLSHPDLITGQRFNYVQNALSQPTKTDLSLQFGAGRTLIPNAAFDSYFSAFPLTTSTGSLTLTVKYTDGDGAKDKSFTLPVDDLTGSSPYFPAGSRFLFDISLTEDLSFDWIDADGYYVTKNGDVNSDDQITVDGKIFTLYDPKKNDYCPEGSVLLSYKFMQGEGLHPNDVRILSQNIALAHGLYHSGGYTHQQYHYFPSLDTRDKNIDEYWLLIVSPVLNSTAYNNQLQRPDSFGYYLDLRCVKK